MPLYQHVVTEERRQVVEGGSEDLRLRASVDWDLLDEPDPTPPLPRRYIDSMRLTPAGRLVVEYIDDTEQDLGVVPGAGAGVAADLDALELVVAGKADAAALAPLALRNSVGPLSVSQLAPSPRWDTFNTAVSPVRLDVRGGNRAASGQTYQHGYLPSPGGPEPTAADVVIETRPDGASQLRLLTSGADYHWTTAAHPIEEAAMAFAFAPGIGAGATKLAGACLAISANTVGVLGATGVFGKAVHISIAPDIMRITLTDGTNGLLPFESGDVYTTTLGLPTDGTPVVVIAKRTARDRIRFVIPGYFDQEVTDSRIPSWWGSTVGIEHLRPLASFGTDAEPLILGWRAGQVVARHAPPTAQGAGLGGIPGAVPGAPVGVVAFSAGFTRYYPLDILNPITLASLAIEVTTASGTPGSKASFAILSADRAWQPRALLAGLGTLATDALGVVSLAGIGLALSARRALLGVRLDVAASLRYLPYQAPGCPGQRTVIGAAPYAQCMGVVEAYAATWPASPTAWNATPASAAPGWLCPAVLTWSES